ncbi:YggS family pyridoxal phosphate-dependent enzyme [Bifidobacterium sp.]|uniref:YggS family pyridoxal phosphate-dependent enzyme n=1 Tax=Bifidobacterium sp. TaxID=41200 RepID=UPI0025C2F03A|nr:YggS family pyridoxal phosphate-dependent enzyme [Bifidobacterium sp.]MCH4209741.1 YggS family pyridoxal phosphate-dependent enzyme [Bifidobacterium sp.]MCI1224903.1 YggS family pyridoxal phosphate-dependent enzyme [Bifidobacterium sp.]
MTSYMEHRDLANEITEAARAQEIADNVRRTLDRIRAAEASAGREPGSVRLLAATKTRDVGEIMAAIGAGIRMIGENRPQEITAKAAGLRRMCAERGFALGRDESDGSDGGSIHIPFHLIGQLQTNKIGKVLPVVDSIESVDSLALAERIARRAVARGIEVGVLLEVNESGESSKSGCNPKNAIDIATRIGIMGGLRLQGLMTIGAHVDDEYAIRKGFERLRNTRGLILESKAPGVEGCTELSMGMTGDMEYAIAEGSTIVRVGTGLFGEREFI